MRQTFRIDVPPGPHTETISAALSIIEAEEVAWEVWAAGDFASSNEWFRLTIDGTEVISQGSGGGDTSPLPEDREDAYYIADGTLQLSPGEFNIDVYVPSTVDTMSDGFGARVWVIFEYTGESEAPDLYRNFAYARIVQTVGESDVEIQLDSVERFPPTEILQKGVFLATIESDLGTGQFEIVRVLGADTGTNRITVLRGVEGTQAYAHPAYTVIKGAVTAQMMHNARAVSVVEGGLPIFDNDIHHEGDVMFDVDNELAFLARGGEWVNFNAGIMRQLGKTIAALAQLARGMAVVEETLYDPPTIQSTLATLGINMVEVLDRVQSWSDIEAGLMRVARMTIHDIIRVDRDDLAEGDSIQYDGVKWTRKPAELDPLSAAIALGG